VPQDEHSAESCLHCEINDLVQKHVEGQEKVDTADLAANLEEAGTWYYVVDCAACKAVIPFKHAPEDEPIFLSDDDGALFSLSHGSQVCA
jgi:hypothetical protein